MFEQSILSADNAAAKTRALAASLGLQALAIATAILIPLISSDHLPHIALTMPLSAPLHIAPEPVPVATTSAAPPSSQSILHVTRVFHLSTAPVRTSGATATTVLQAADFSGAAGDVAIPGIPAGVYTALPVLTAVAPKPAPVVVKPVEKPAPIPQRVGGDVQAAKLIRKVIPAYPPLAKAARVSGIVKLSGVIAKDGTIERLELLSGNPLLAPAAIDAVKRWLYRPTYLNGQPVEVIAPIDVVFTLQ